MATRLGVANEPRLATVSLTWGVVAVTRDVAPLSAVRRGPRREGRTPDAEAVRTACEAAVPAGPDPRTVLPVGATVEPRAAVTVATPAIADVQAQGQVAEAIGAAGP